MISIEEYTISFPILCKIRSCLLLPETKENNDLSLGTDLFPRLAPTLNSARSVWAADRPHSVHPVKRTHPARFKLHGYIEPIQQEEIAPYPCTMHLNRSRQIYRWIMYATPVNGPHDACEPRPQNTRICSFDYALGRYVARGLAIGYQGAESWIQTCMDFSEVSSHNLHRVVQ